MTTPQTQDAALDNQQLAELVARDIPAGAYVNLGIGIPTLVANYVGDKDITAHVNFTDVALAAQDAGLDVLGVALHHRPQRLEHLGHRLVELGLAGVAREHFVAQGLQRLIHGVLLGRRGRDAPRCPRRGAPRSEEAAVPDAHPDRECALLPK